MIVRRELLAWIPDELIAVEVRDDRGVQLAVGNQFPEVRKAVGQQMQELPERFRLDIEVCHACSFARNAEEFDVHASRKLMIALAVTPTFQ